MCPRSCATWARFKNKKNNKKKGIVSAEGGFLRLQRSEGRVEQSGTGVLVAGAALP